MARVVRDWVAVKRAWRGAQEFLFQGGNCGRGETGSRQRGWMAPCRRDVWTDAGTDQERVLGGRRLRGSESEPGS